MSATATGLLGFLQHLVPKVQLPLFDSEPLPNSFVVRVSGRARRLSVRVYPAGRVEVVVPPRTPARLVQQFVSRHREWIDERVKECAVQAAALTVPKRIDLPALGRVIHLEHRQETGAPRLRLLGEDQWLLRGNLQQPAAWSRVLKQALSDLAQEQFDARLRGLAEQYGFRFERLQIRRQRTRWGSCSSSGTISLNLCGLFVSPAVLRYLMIHELSHTKHMNHSARFWQEVARCEPQYKVLDKELSVAWRSVPVWLFAGK